jgi:hypothetical protein
MTMLKMLKLALPLAVALGLGFTAPAMAQRHFWQSPGNDYSNDSAAAYTRDATRHRATSAYARGALPNRAARIGCVPDSPQNNDSSFGSAFPSWDAC